MRPIDADDAIHQIDMGKDGYNIAFLEETDSYTSGAFDALDRAISVLETVPTLDVMPVKRGRWIDNKKSIIGEIIERNCSLCGQRTTGLYDHFFPYCPNCGAKMDEKEGA